MIRCLYPHHIDPRDLGLHPWLEVLRDTERGFVCACCGVKQHPWRPQVFMPQTKEFPHLAAVLQRSRPSIARSVALFLPVAPWCISCAWAACGRQMVRRRGRRWWQFWR